MTIILMSAIAYKYVTFNQVTGKSVRIGSGEPGLDALLKSNFAELPVGVCNPRNSTQVQRATSVQSAKTEQIVDVKLKKKRNNSPIFRADVSPVFSEYLLASHIKYFFI